MNITSIEKLEEEIKKGEELLKFDTKGQLSTRNSMNVARVMDAANYIVLLNGTGIVGVKRK